MYKNVFATFTAPGFHNWPGAPEKYEYLRSLHRHEFHIRVDVRVSHDQRDVEFIEMKEEARSAFLGLGEHGIRWGAVFGAMSCEMLAEALCRALLHRYNVASVMVSEDGENGAVFQRL